MITYCILVPPQIETEIIINTEEFIKCDGNRMNIQTYVFLSKELHSFNIMANLTITKLRSIPSSIQVSVAKNREVILTMSTLKTTWPSPPPPSIPRSGKTLPQNPDISLVMCAIHSAKRSPNIKLIKPCACSFPLHKPSILHPLCFKDDN